MADAWRRIILVKGEENARRGVKSLETHLCRPRGSVQNDLEAL